MRLFELAILFIVAVAPVEARAELTLSSPVAGYCQIGKYTPVEVAHSGAGDVLIEADGAIRRVRSASAALGRYPSPRCPLAFGP
jgi:hypothetical protein